MPLLCLIGRHGSGKSTIGTKLAEEGYRHISVGLLRRLAQSKQYPSDVPVLLISAMRRERAGALLSPQTAQRLVEYACSNSLTVLDGFPADPEQVKLLPADTIFCVAWTPLTLRSARLEARAATTKRQWVPGRHSEREANLPRLISHVRLSHRCLFVRNAGDLESVVAELTRKIARS
jgi:adenylate kinase family enzyme